MDGAGQRVLDRDEGAIGLPAGHRREERVERRPRRGIQSAPSSASTASWLNAPRSPWIATVRLVVPVARSGMLSPLKNRKARPGISGSGPRLRPIGGLALHAVPTRSIGAGKDESGHPDRHRHRGRDYGRRAQVVKRGLASILGRPHADAEVREEHAALERRGQDLLALVGGGGVTEDVVARGAARSARAVNRARVHFRAPRARLHARTGRSPRSRPVAQSPSSNWGGHRTGPLRDGQGLDLLSPSGFTHFQVPRTFARPSAAPGATGCSTGSRPGRCTRARDRRAPSSGRGLGMGDHLADVLPAEWSRPSFPAAPPRFHGPCPAPIRTSSSPPSRCRPSWPRALLSGAAARWRDPRWAGRVGGAAEEAAPRGLPSALPSPGPPPGPLMSIELVTSFTPSMWRTMASWFRAPATEEALPDNATTPFSTSTSMSRAACAGWTRRRRTATAMTPSCTSCRSLDSPAAGGGGRLRAPPLRLGRVAAEEAQGHHGRPPPLAPRPRGGSKTVAGRWGMGGGENTVGTERRPIGRRGPRHRRGRSGVCGIGGGVRRRHGTGPGYGDGPGTGGVLGTTRARWRADVENPRPEPAAAASTGAWSRGSGKAEHALERVGHGRSRREAAAGFLLQGLHEHRQRASPGLLRSGLTLRGSGGGVCRWWRQSPSRYRTRRAGGR